MKDVELVSFDLDDTLCLTELACFNLENSVAQRLGFEAMPRESHVKTWGEPLELAIPQRFPGISVSDFMKVFKIEMPLAVKAGKLDIVPDYNLATLEELKRRGKILTVLTSRGGGVETAHFLEEEHALAALVDSFYHKDNSEYFKPDPRVFSKMLSDYKIKPEQALYVGDGLGDAISSKSAGLHFVATLESGLRTEEDFKSVQVDHFIRRLPELLKLL